MQAMLLSLYIAQSLSYAQKGYWDNFCIDCADMARQLSGSTNETICFFELIEYAEQIAAN